MDIIPLYPVQFKLVNVDGYVALGTYFYFFLPGSYKLLSMAYLQPWAKILASLEQTEPNLRRTYFPKECKDRDKGERCSSAICNCQRMRKIWRQWRDEAKREEAEINEEKLQEERQKQEQQRKILREKELETYKEMWRNRGTPLTTPIPPPFFTLGPSEIRKKTHVPMPEHCKDPLTNRCSSSLCNCRLLYRIQREMRKVKEELAKLGLPH